MPSSGSNSGVVRIVLVGGVHAEALHHAFGVQHVGLRSVADSSQVALSFDGVRRGFHGRVRIQVLDQDGAVSFAAAIALSYTYWLSQRRASSDMNES